MKKRGLETTLSKVANEPTIASLVPSGAPARAAVRTAGAVSLQEITATTLLAVTSGTAFAAANTSPAWMPATERLRLKARSTGVLSLTWEVGGGFRFTKNKRSFQ